MFNPVDPGEISEYDRIAYSEGVEDLIELDAVLVVASGNIDVSSSFKVPPTSDQYFIRLQ